MIRGTAVKLPMAVWILCSLLLSACTSVPEGAYSTEAEFSEAQARLPDLEARCAGRGPADGACDEAAVTFHRMADFRSERAHFLEARALVARARALDPDSSHTGRYWRWPPRRHDTTWNQMVMFLALFAFGAVAAYLADKLEEVGKRRPSTNLDGISTLPGTVFPLSLLILIYLGYGWWHHEMPPAWFLAVLGLVGVLFYLLLLSVFMTWWRYREEARRPQAHDDPGAGESELSMPDLPPRPPPSDLVFISYRSTDVAFVRPVVEALMAQGLDVWLAEYHSLPANFERWEEEVRKGVESSKWAILFTSAEWASSSACLWEAQLVMERLPAGRVIHIPLSAEDLAPGAAPVLRRAGTHEIHAALGPPEQAGARILATVRAILTVLGRVEYPTWVGDTAATHAYSPHLAGISYDAFDMGRDVRPAEAAALYGLVGMHKASHQGAEVKLNVWSTPYTTTLPRGARSIPLNTSPLELSRKLASYYRAVVQKWSKTASVHLAGLHLVPLAGRSAADFAITYASPFGGGRMEVERRYVLTRLDPQGRPEGEVVFVFSMRIPPDRVDLFASLTPLFDRIVGSLRLTEVVGQEEKADLLRPWNQGKLVWILGASLLSWRLADGGWAEAGWACLAAFLGVDLLLSHTRKRGQHWYMATGTDIPSSLLHFSVAAIADAVARTLRGSSLWAIVLIGGSVMLGRLEPDHRFVALIVAGLLLGARVGWRCPPMARMRRRWT